MDYAREFTPELNSRYLASLLKPYEEEERKLISAAGQRYQSGGLNSQAAYGAEVGAIEAGIATGRAKAVAGFDLDVANRRYTERLTNEQRSFDVEEARKHREFQEHMASLGFQFAEGNAEAERGYQRVQGQQGAVWGLGSSLLSAGASVYGSYKGAGDKGAVAGSDERLKTEVKRVGQAGPFGVYTYRFKENMGLDLPKGPQRGVMAQEVKKLYPELIGDLSGFMSVNYAGLREVLKRDYGVVAEVR